jgi:transposase-like protein
MEIKICPVCKTNHIRIQEKLSERSIKFDCPVCGRIYELKILWDLEKDMDDRNDFNVLR